MSSTIPATPTGSVSAAAPYYFVPGPSRWPLLAGFSLLVTMASATGRARSSTGQRRSLNRWASLESLNSSSSP